MHIHHARRGFELRNNIRHRPIDLHVNPFNSLELESQILRRIDGDNLSSIDNDHAMTRLFDFGQDVRRENDRVLPGKLLNQLTHFVYLFWIEPNRRLVENQNRRIVD